MEVVSLTIDFETFWTEIDASCRDVVIQMSFASVVSEESQETSFTDIGGTHDNHLKLFGRTHDYNIVVPLNDDLWYASLKMSESVRTEMFKQDIDSKVCNKCSWLSDTELGEK